MFRSLHVKNFAIIADINLDFEAGLTILTGETGAGKSLIIDATRLLLGGRLTTKVVRPGTDKAIIEGVFENYNQQVKNLLNEYGIEELEDDLLIIRREINAASKSIARINGMVVTLTQLECIGSYLMDIHTQNDTKKLFDTHNYLDFIDSASTREILNVYLVKRKNYLETLKKYQELKNDKEQDLKQLDFLKFQLNELENAHLIETEEQDLQNELDYLNNFENINQLLTNIKSEFKDNNIIESVYDTMNSFEKMTQYNDNYQSLTARLENIYYELKDILETVNGDYYALEYDEERLNELNARLQYLTNLKRKYHTDISGLLKYKEELSYQVKLNENYDELLDETKKALLDSYQELLAMALQLSNERKKNAKNLVEDVLRTLDDLILPRVYFDIQFIDNCPINEFDSSKFKNNGIDTVDFLISFNVGQSATSLAKIASGGEMSRIMLALKVHLTKHLKLSTIIFDEIDSGISRNVAAAVGTKMKEISKNCQVLAITHLPIVASYADEHMFINKDTIEEQTIVKVQKLTEEERIKELAYMLSPNSHQSEMVRQIAIEMLSQNK